MRFFASTRKEYAVVVWGLRPDNTRSRARSYRQWTIWVYCTSSVQLPRLDMIVVIVTMLVGSAPLTQAKPGDQPA